MPNLDDILIDLNNNLNSSEQQMRTLLNGLSLEELFNETSTMRADCNSTVLEYNRINEDDTENALKFFPEVDVDCPKHEIIDLYINLYKIKVALVNAIENMQDLARARSEYVSSSVTGEDLIVSPSDSTSTEFHSQMGNASKEYKECYQTIQVVVARLKLEQEYINALQEFEDSSNEFGF